MVPSLAVLNSGGAKLEGGKLTMTGIAPNSIVFADRPVRAAGHVLTADFIKQWDEGNDSFAKDPPNATISVMSSDGSAIEDAVVVLKTPKLEGDTLTFDVAVLEGEFDERQRAGLAVHRLVRRPRRLWPRRRRRRPRLACPCLAWRLVRPSRRVLWRRTGHRERLSAPRRLRPTTRTTSRSPACGYYPYPPCY